MSFLAHQAAYRTTRWAAWRIRNRKQISAQKKLRAYEQMTEQERIQHFIDYIRNEDSNNKGDNK